MSIICALCAKCKCVYLCVSVLVCGVKYVISCCICWCLLNHTCTHSKQAVAAVSWRQWNRIVWVFIVYVRMQMNFALNTKSECPVVTCLCITVCPCNRSCTLCPGLSLHLSCDDVFKPVIQVAGLLKRDVSARNAFVTDLKLISNNSFVVLIIYMLA